MPCGPCHSPEAWKGQMDTVFIDFRNTPSGCQAVVLILVGCVYINNLPRTGTPALEDSECYMPRGGLDSWIDTKCATNHEFDIWHQKCKKHTHKNTTNNNTQIRHLTHQKCNTKTRIRHFTCLMRKPGLRVWGRSPQDRTIISYQCW
jgi:hypothetical protein